MFRCCILDLIQEQYCRNISIWNKAYVSQSEKISMQKIIKIFWLWYIRLIFNMQLA